jgi:DNA-binding transcriptional LysR family regulator
MGRMPAGNESEKKLDKLARIKIFARVAERGGFSSAGRDLGLSQSVVSKAVAALEKELGARLLSRSTRQVALTEAGRTYYRHCRNILAELELAEAAVGAAQSGLAGQLNIAAPVPFGLMFVSPRAARFQALHPGLSIGLDLSDRCVDLVENNIDVAIRLGRVGGDGVAARKLGDSPFLTVAAPDYLARRGEPRRPEQLGDHDCLVYDHAAAVVAWDFDAASGIGAVNVAGRFRANNLLAVRDAALAGLGIARLPLWMTTADLDAGTLRPLLSEFPPPPYAIHAVFPTPRRIPAKARQFADFMQDELAALTCFSDLLRAHPASV